jgi:hypothetical protein
MNNTTAALDYVADFARDFEVAMYFVRLLIGTVGNILCFTVMNQKNMSGNSASIYFAAIAVADTLFMYFGIVKSIIEYFDGPDITGSNEWVCKIYHFLWYSAGDVALWLILAVTVDRYIAVALPFKARHMCTAKRARIVIIVLAALAAGKNLNAFWAYGIEHIMRNGVQSVNMCGYPSYFALYFRRHIRPWVTWVLVAAVPAMTIFVLNILILRKMEKTVYMRSSTNRESASRIESPSQNETVNNGVVDNAGSELLQSSPPSSNQPSLRQMSVMLLAISAVFLILVLPCFTYSVVKRVFFKRPRTGFFVLVDVVVQVLLYTNHAINFYLYCLTGNGFRRMVKLLFCGSRTRHMKSHLNGHHTFNETAA